METALNALRDVGSVADMNDLASRGFAPARRPKANMHIHLPPNFSAFNTVQQAVDLAAEQGVGLLGLSNYYDYEVYGQFAALARKRRIFPIFGLEIICMIDELRRAGIRINDPGNPGKMYICGKGITKFARMTTEARRVLDLIRLNDSRRMDQMVRAMEKVFAERGLPTNTTTETVIDMVVRRHGSPRHTVYLQERHVAQAFQEAVFTKVPADQRIDRLSNVFGAAVKKADPVSMQNDIRTHLMKAGKPAFVEETFIGFDDAHGLIVELGGIPCYPVLADSCSPVCEFEASIEKLIRSITSRNIYAVEFIAVRNSVAALSRYAKAMRAAGLVVTAGTEHNTLDLIPIEPVCTGGAPIPQDLKEIFWEGACVAAAHQFLKLHGQTGFVDSAGKPNPQYEDAESRITAFARLGSAVISKYQEPGAS